MSDLDRPIEQLRRGEYLKESEVQTLCARAREILIDESNVQRVDAPLTVRDFAAADWSWLPMGTRFRLIETGRVYVIEDYGTALVGRKTIDLYMPNEPMMRAWGVKMVNIEVLEWGSKPMSRMLLETRRNGATARRMLAAMETENPRTP